jgi:hypothetical protein
VEPARVETLDKIGEGRQAFDIAVGWVRAKLKTAADLPPDAPAP